MTRPEVDLHHVGIEGVSRYGKAALIAAAFDQRFAMVLIGSSGEANAGPAYGQCRGRGSSRRLRMSL